MNKISLCWEVNRTDDGSLFLHCLTDDGRATYGFLDLRLEEKGIDWPRFFVGDKLVITIERAKE